MDSGKQEDKWLKLARQMGKKMTYGISIMMDQCTLNLFVIPSLQTLYYYM